jgi:hypothetical protein
VGVSQSRIRLGLGEETRPDTTGSKRTSARHSDLYQGRNSHQRHTLLLIYLGAFLMIYIELDMPTGYNSTLYMGNPRVLVDAVPIITLRAAGAFLKLEV